MLDPSQDSADLFRKSWNRLEQVIAQFEEAWQSGQRPAIDEYLRKEDIEPRKLLVELAHTDLECRLKAGEAVRVEAYLERYAELAADRQAALGLIAAEFNVRRRREPGLDLHEYEQRFPQFRSDLAERLHGPHPSAAGSGAARGSEQSSAAAPSTSRLGQFELLETIGRGAFGSVFRARDLELDRIVALKVPRPDRSLTTADMDRFAREARNAAQLSHSGIVPVYKVGHDAAVPYIVSAYVEGTTLADTMTGRRLDFRQITEVLAQVAEALDHAHAHGVVHRDLKPSNIMLGRIEGAGGRSQESEDRGQRTEDRGQKAEGRRQKAEVERGRSFLTPDSCLLTPGARAFVMDFGLAHRDEGEIRMTMEGQILGTPAYMSPEQARGQSHRVDGRSDIYSAGVILYELLTGELPFRGSARMVLQQILDEEPRPPRKLNDKIPRDLETIALKCLAKEPGRRYATGAALAGDLRRHLDGIPILARPVGRLERGWRWAKRNPWVAGLSTAVAVLFVAVAIGSTATSIIISRQRDEIGVQRDAAVLAQEQAQESAESARKHLELTLETLSKLVNQVQEELRYEPALAALQEKVLGEALTGLQRVADITQNADTDPIMSSAHLKLGDIFLQLGRIAEAKQQYEICQAITEHSTTTDAEHARFQRTRCVATTKLGEVSLRGNDVRAAQEYGDIALSMAQTLAEASPQKAQALRDLAMAYSLRGNIGMQRAELEAAAESYAKAVGLAERALDAEPNNFEIKDLLAAFFEHLGDARRGMKDLAEARAAYDQCMELRVAMVAAQPKNPRAKRALSISYERLGDIAFTGKKYAPAQEWYGKALAQREQLAANAPKNSLTQREFAIALGKLGQVAEFLGDNRAARDYYDRACERFGNLAEAYPSDVRFRRDRAVAHLKLGVVNRRLGETQKAREHRSKAVAEFEAIAAMNVQNTMARVDLADCCGDVGEAEIQAKDFTQAARYFERGIAVLRELEAEGKLKEQSEFRDLLPQQQRHLEFCQNAERLLEAAGRGQHAEATKAADKLRELAGKNAGLLYDFAGCLALSAKTVAPGKKEEELTQPEKTARQEYMARAVQALNDAVAQGYKDVSRLESDADLAALRTTSGYQELVARLKAHK